jgi:alpha-tubulin suppressor-like RCC1 family protein
MRRALLLAVTACGRIAFDPRGDAGDAPADARVDAPVDHLAQIVAGGVNTCARLDDGNVYCWGSAAQLGTGDTSTNRGVPQHVELPMAAIDLDVGDYGVCALLANHQVMCWGSNVSGEVGVVGAHPLPTLPTQPAGIDETVGAHVVCLRHGGRVACAGAGGELGDGTASDRPAFSDVPALDDAIALTAGENHACALRATGAVTCWGLNTSHRDRAETARCRTTRAPRPDRRARTSSSPPATTTRAACTPARSIAGARTRSVSSAMARA